MTHVYDTMYIVNKFKGELKTMNLSKLSKIKHTLIMIVNLKTISKSDINTLLPIIDKISLTQQISEKEVTIARSMYIKYLNDCIDEHIQYVKKQYKIDRAVKIETLINYLSLELAGCLSTYHTDKTISNIICKTLLSYENNDIMRKFIQYQFMGELVNAKHFYNLMKMLNISPKEFNEEYLLKSNR